VTRDQLGDYSQEMTSLMVSMLHCYRVRRDAEIDDKLRWVYETLAREQNIDRAALSRQIETLGIGLAAERTSAAARRLGPDTIGRPEASGRLISEDGAHRRGEEVP